ncbi:MAG: hypothetical protein IIW94_01275 [Clostridia bacterium]|nr:hypothetical protein [Clostridia bacterium]
MKSFFTKERIRAIISFVFAFFVSLGLFGAAISAGALYFIKDSTITACIKNSNYTALATECLTEELNELAIPSGLPEDFFDGKIDQKEFENIFYNSLKNVLSKNSEYTINLDGFKNSVATAVNEYVKDTTDDITEDIKNDITSFSDACGNIYLSYVNPSLLSYILNLLTKAYKYIIAVNAVCAVLALACGFALFRMNSTSRFIKYAFGAVSGAALSVGVIPGYLLITNEVSKIGITLKSLHAVISALANNFLIISVVIALILATFALILASIKIFGLIFRK